MSNPLSQPQLEQQLRDSYGLLLTISQLAELLGRTPAGLRWTLASKDCLRTVGGRAYISATDVAAILADERC